MLKSIFLIAAIVAASSAHAGQMRTAECDSDIQACYAQMQRACPRGFSIADRNSFYADALSRDFPPGFWVGLSRQFNTYLFQCQ